MSLSCWCFWTLQWVEVIKTAIVTAMHANEVLIQKYEFCISSLLEFLASLSPCHWHNTVLYIEPLRPISLGSPPSQTCTSALGAQHSTIMQHELIVERTRTITLFRASLGLCITVNTCNRVDYVIVMLLVFKVVLLHYTIPGLKLIEGQLPNSDDLPLAITMASNIACQLAGWIELEASMCN